MRRFVPIFVFLVVLGAPFVLRGMLFHPQSVDTSASLRLVIITPNNQDICREFAQAFDAWHREKYGQGAVLDYRTPGGTSDIERLLRSVYKSNRGPDGKLDPNFQPDYDMVWGGGDYFQDQVLTKAIDATQSAAIDPKLLHEAFPSPTLAGIKLYDTAAGGPRWIGTCLSSFGIVYNPDLLSALGVPSPRTWGDLTDPRLSSFVALADPTHSGSAAIAYLIVMQRQMADAETDFLSHNPDLKKIPRKDLAQRPDYTAAIARGWKVGMIQLLRIAANARYFADDAQAVPSDVSRGDAAAGMAIDFFARTTEQIVGPARVQFIAPVGATATLSDPISILAGVRGERFTLANHFIEFLLSRQGQLLWALPVGAPGGPTVRRLQRSPIRRDVYADRTGWEDIPDPFTQSGGFNERLDWMSTFTETKMLWFAAWIDCRDDLRSAYQKILSDPDPVSRDARLAALSDLPVEMSDVIALHNEFKALKIGADEWSARKRIEWSRRFRKHYRKFE